MCAGKACEAPKAMPWYPQQLAWQMDCSRMQLRKVPILGELHEFIKRETAAGSISRQEAVSMVPPLFLDVQPDHAVRCPLMYPHAPLRRHLHSSIHPQARTGA